MNNFQKWATLLVALVSVVVSGACMKQSQEQCQNQSQDGSTSTCGNPTGPSVVPPAVTHPSIATVFVKAGSGEVGCNEFLVIQGSGFTPGKEVVVRVTKVGGVYNDFPQQGRQKLFADGSGAFQFIFEYKEFWDTGTFSVRAFDVQTGIWTPESAPFTVKGCGGGGRANPAPTPTPVPTPTPTPTPTPMPPTPPPPCVPAPSLSVSPTSGTKGTLFVLRTTGLCAGATVSWTVEPFGVVATTSVSLDGTSTWTYNSSGETPPVTRSGFATSGGKISNVVSWTIQ